MDGVLIAPHHRLLVVDGAAVVRADDERSTLRHALLAQLAVTRTEAGGSAVSLGGRVRARFGADGAVELAAPLTAFEARYLADNGVPLAVPELVHPFSPKTDLHTHFAACLSGAELVALGAEHGVVLEPALLAEAGVFVEAPIAAAALDVRARGRLAAALDLPVDQQSFFLEMERRYVLRRPFTHAAPLFRPQLERIARRFAASGVSYAELSLSDCLEPARLEVLHASLGPIERETGVRLRFLVAFRRDDDLEWDLDVLARFEACLESRAVVGIDVMGHETCSTRAFLPVLARAAELARARPGFVVRVHAGENPAYPENVREAFLALRDEDAVELRIGHGIYGVDDALLGELAARGERVIVELNLGSNLALNNVQSTRQLPLRRYLDAGVTCVLGTDGAGLYATSAADEVRAAIACGLEAHHLDQLARMERALLARKAAREAELPALGAFVAPPPAPPLHYGPHVAAKKAAEREGRRRALDARIGELTRSAGPAPYDPHARPTAHGRPVLWLSGAWRSAIATWPAADVERARAILEALMPELARRGALLVTGGTTFGVEGLAHEAAARHGVEVLGAIVEDLDPAWLDPRVDRFWCCAPSLWKKTEPLALFVREHDGLALFVGGGLIVADEHQASANLGLRHVVARGFTGPAADAARLAPATRFVDDARAIAQALDDRTPRGKLWHAGPNDAVDLVIVRGAAEVLLVRRHDRSGAASGWWSLPGGFVLAGEDLREAARRVLERETGLAVDPAALRAVGVVEGPGRDPRDTPERWVRSHVFSAELAQHGPITAAAGAARATFVPLDHLPPLAFDHAALIAEARGRTGAAAP